MVYDDRLTDSECRSIGRGFFVKSGKNLVDLLRCPKHYHTEIAPLIDVEGLDHFDRAYKRGHGVIGVTGHIGHFELLAIYFAQIGYKASAIGREMYDPKLDELLEARRRANGVTIFATTDSPRGILKWLRDGGVLGVLMDVDSIRVRSEFVPFFGRPALTPVGQTIVGLKTGAAFVPVACVRTENNRYKIVVKPEIPVAPSGDFDRDVITVTAACNRALEPIIDQYRDQWIWLKNRWLTQPSEKT
ncbi:MAG: lysophospholipid acyltransferase family protein, partial [candidate division Zixibacteria bacterium]|nr:lysophospholipid acyltransferase family protein [candidate division Zixibacteria bacterium]